MNADNAEMTLSCTPTTPSPFICVYLRSSAANPSPLLTKPSRFPNLLNVKQASRGPMTSIADRERNPARTRAAILDAAEKLFAQKGFDATSLNEVGLASGVSRGTPGYFFGSKAELYQAVLDRSLRRGPGGGPDRPGAGPGQRAVPRGDPGGRRLRLFRLPRRPAQLHPPDRARGAERGPAARRGQPPLRRAGGARRHQRRARPRGFGRGGAAVAQHHRPLLVPSDPCPHRRPRGRRGAGASRRSRAAPAAHRRPGPERSAPGSTRPVASTLKPVAP